GDHVVQQRHAGYAMAVAGAAEAIVVAGGEAAGERLLVFAKHVHAKMTALREQGVNRGTLVNANENQRRLERQRREGADGHSGGLAIVAHSGYDGDAARKT